MSRKLGLRNTTGVLADETKLPCSQCCTSPRTTPRVLRREHHERTGKKTLFKQTIKISDIDHTLPPGVWVYPFSIQIPPSVPGVTKHKRKVDSNDPAWRSAGRKCETKFESVFTVKAVLQTKGVFSKDLKSRQELVVNPFFDWSKMAPAKADKSGTVMLCCCIPRGMVHLTSTYDKAAFQAGEVGMPCRASHTRLHCVVAVHAFTFLVPRASFHVAVLAVLLQTMRVSATIKNESKSNVKEMISRLNRFITITDGHGNRKTFHDEESFSPLDLLFCSPVCFAPVRESHIPQPLPLPSSSPCRWPRPSSPVWPPVRPPSVRCR